MEDEKKADLPRGSIVKVVEDSLEYEKEREEIKIKRANKEE